MNKVELAKMIGLEKDYDNCYIQKEDLQASLKMHWCKIELNFCDNIINVRVDKSDFTKDKLDIKEEDLIEEGDIKTCTKQVEDLLWERAADRYLEMVHNSAMLIGGK